jgi:glycosyltransferase involved in cell wall biosynthesis
MATPMKILLAAPLPPPAHGGVANWSRVICQELGKRNDLRLSFVDTNVRYRSITNISLLSRLAGGSAQAFRDAYRVFRAIRNERPDIFHLCTTGGLASVKDILMLRIARHYRVPSILHYRVGSLPERANRNGVSWKLSKLAMSLANAVVLLDSRSRSAVREALPDSLVECLPNMVDLEEIDEIRRTCATAGDVNRERKKIVFVGHVLPYKGIRELIEACKQMEANAFTLDLTGPVEPDFRKEIEILAQTNGDGEWFRLQNFVSHVEAVGKIASCDIFVLPSHTEGFPNVLLEAMACAKAIVGTDVGAVPEALNIGGTLECGICLPSCNSEAIANALAELLNDAEKRRTLGLAARRRVEENYSSVSGCKRLVDFWQTVAKR